MQQRLVCVEAGQTFSIQRVKVLTPQFSGIHCRLTRGRSLIRSQPGPSQVLAGKAVGRRTFVILVVGRAARYRAISGHLSISQKRNVVRVGVGACDSVGFGTTRMGFEAGCRGGQATGDGQLVITQRSRSISSGVISAIKTGHLQRTHRRHQRQDLPAARTNRNHVRAAYLSAHLGPSCCAAVWRSRWQPSCCVTRRSRPPVRLCPLKVPAG